jgi:hypothetical protein
MGRWIYKGSWWVWLGLNGVLAAAVGILLWSGAEAQQEMPQSLPVVSFSGSEYVVGEGDGTVTITVTLSQSSTETVAVDYATSDGTAVGYASEDDPGDYGSANGTLQFAPGETAKTIAILILQDCKPEANETFTLTLNNPVGASLGAPSTSTITILDDDYHDEP